MRPSGNYLRYITGENAGAHVSNKLSILRKFLGWKRTEDITQDLFPRKALNGRQTGQDREPCFTGTYLDEITAPVVQNFIESQELSRPTKRHYREESST